MSHSDQLHELLRRCHRGELLDLARILRVKPEGMGLSALSHHLARTLRRRGRHELRNLLSGGEGPDYGAVADRVARKVGVIPGISAVETEAQLLDWTLTRSWEEMDADGRAELWHDMGMEPPAPEDASTAVAEARQVLGRSFGYTVGFSVVGNVVRAGLLFVPLLSPFAGCLTIWWLGRPRDDVLIPAVLEVAKLRQAVLHRVTIGVVGSPSCGKDAAIMAVFGVDTGNIDPVAGSTKEVSITRLQGATALYVVNTPGLGDVVEAVSEEARQVLDHIDVYLYVVNAQGGVQARELSDWAAIVRSGRPALAVVNKVDTLRDKDRERYLEDARAKLGVAEEDFLPTAFDPLPQLADEPVGVHEVRAWLTDHLVELGKDPQELPWEQAEQGVSVAP